MDSRRVDVVDKYGGLHALVDSALAGTGHPVRRVSPDAFLDSEAFESDAGLSVVSLCLPPDDMVLARKRIEQLQTPFVVVAGCGAMTTAGPVLFPGAKRVLPFSVDPAVLRQLVLGLLDEVPSTVPAVAHGMVGTSEPFRRLVAAIEQVAATESTVLLEGETGTGKELTARAIHDLSRRSGGPFVAVDCGALSESLMESELFGHARGAFTGATKARAGLFEAADGGTLFLDQIDDVSPEVQMKLLRTLQEWEIRRVGSVKRRPIDVRLVAASRTDLKKAVEAGRFRKDLYYRLKVYHIRVPPLRDRMEDVDALVDHALERSGCCPDQCSQLFREILRGYDWPGNIRQLLAVVESATIQSEHGRIEAHHLPADFIESWRNANQPTEEPPCPEPETVAKVLEQTGGNRSEAAKILGISRTTLWRRMTELGLD